jgi:hypothetical protein
MKLVQLPNLRAEDFPSEQAWIGRLFVQLNPFIQTVNQVIDQNIDFATNIRSVTQEIQLPSGFQEFSVKWPFPNQKPKDFRITQATKTTQKDPCILVCSWSFDSGTDVITCENILELTEDGVSELDGQYNFTVRATI